VTIYSPWLNLLALVVRHEHGHRLRRGFFFRVVGAGDRDGVGPAGAASQALSSQLQVVCVQNHPLGSLAVNGRLIARDCQHPAVGAGRPPRAVTG